MQRQKVLEALTSYTATPNYPSQGVALYMKHLYMNVSNADGQLNTGAIFIKLPAFDGCRCLGGCLQKDESWPDLLESWVSPRAAGAARLALRSQAATGERRCSSQGVRSDFRFLTSH